MKNRAYHAATYEFSEGESVLIDANIWLFLEPPAGGRPSSWAHTYGEVFKKLLTAKARPVTDALVISEYLNRYFRIEYEGGWTDQFENFKAFRNSEYFEGLAEDAVAAARRITGLSSVRDTELTLCDMNEILAATQSGDVDFNDAVIVECCRVQGWKLLTNDGDFTNGGIDVLTELPALIRGCQ